MVSKNRKISDLYDKNFQKTHITRPAGNGETSYNYAYYPLVFASEKELLDVKNALEKKRIFPRRYFYPSLNNLPYIYPKQKCPVSESVSKRVLCLPLYYDLSVKDVKRIIRIVLETIKSR